MSGDPWVHRSEHMRCKTCMWFAPKAGSNGDATDLGRCRRRAPTMSGFPAVFLEDWCGDHKLDENAGMTVAEAMEPSHPALKWVCIKCNGAGTHHRICERFNESPGNRVLPRDKNGAVVTG